MPTRPSFLVSAVDVPETRHRYPNSEEQMAPSRAIGRTAGLRQIGLTHQKGRVRQLGVEPIRGHAAAFPYAEAHQRF